MISRLDLQALIDRAGVDGASAELRAAKDVSTESLRSLARSEGLPVSSKIGREELIDTLVAPDRTRIDRQPSELATLSEEGIIAYLTDIGCTSLELSRYLEAAGIPYDRGVTRNALVRHAARELSRIGLYRRIAGDHSAED